MFDKATGIIVQGGRRRGADMGLLHGDHTDIIEFIEAKAQRDGYAEFTREPAEILIENLGPLQVRYRELTADRVTLSRF